MKCVVDQRRQALRGQVCDPCRADARIILLDVVDLYALLPEHLEPVRGVGPKVSGSRTPPVPLRLDVVDLILPARNGNVHDDWHDQYGQLSVATVLDGWVRDWAEVRHEHLPAPTVVELAGWMLGRLSWACDEHPAVDECIAHLRSTRAVLRRAVGRTSGRVYIGVCPVELDEGPCRAILMADPDVDVLRCPRCRTEWPRSRWLWLGTLLREAG